MGELFTEEQLRKAAEIMKDCPTPHEDLVQLLNKDKDRFDKLEVHIPYAAYMIEAHRNLILHVYL
jgi:hypothetical protein